MREIDFVITWVDGSDPAWQAEKAKYQNRPAGTDNRAVRYRDWDTLRYWFRAVERYAPWVRKIHFVTWGHVPQWLNLECPKLHIVRHEDFIPAQYLPTFSSHPIEMNLHRIPGLAEQFVYFNDDFFLTAPVEPEDFFIRGLPRDSLEEQAISMKWERLIVYIKANDITFTNRQFSKKAARRQNWRKWFSPQDPKSAVRNLLSLAVGGDQFFGLNVHHLPQAYLRQTFEQVWQAEPQWLHETCTHKFRDAQDVSQCVFKFWQLASGNFVPCNKKRYGHFFPGGSEPEETARAIRTQKYKYICCNDGADIDFERCRSIVCGAFEEVFPEKSAFEREM